MFQWNMNFRVPEAKKLAIQWYKDWLYQNWVEEVLPHTTLRYLENFDYNDTWSLMSRKNSVENALWVQSSDSNDAYPIIAIGYLDRYYIYTRWNNYYYSTWFWNLFTKITSFTITDAIQSYNSSSPWFKDNSDTNIYDLVNFFTIKSTSGSYTITEYNERYVKTWTTLTKDALIWSYLKIWNEYKYITANTTDTIYIAWTFDEIYAVATAFTIWTKTDCLIYVNKYISTANVLYDDWWIQKKNLTHQINMWDVYANRFFYTRWSNRLYFSELWIVDWTWKNNYIDLKSTILKIKAFWNRLIIYTLDDIVYLYWDNQDNFSLEYLKTSKTIAKVNAVANWNNIQFYYWNQWLEILDYIDNKISANTLWISEKISDLIKENSSSQWNPFMMEVFDNKCFIWIWRKVIVYDIDKSQKFNAHIFTVYDFWDITTASINAYSWYKPSVIKKINSQIIFAINWTTVTFWTKFYRVNATSNPLTIESNKIDLWDNLRKKIFRRIKVNINKRYNASQTVWYTTKIYIKFDEWSYTLIKTSTDLTTEAFFWGLMNNFQYKLEITPTLNTDAYTPIELLQLDVQFELQNKY